MNPLDPLVQVYILSFNRPDFIQESIESVLAQNYSQFELIVSDNSTNDQVEKLMSRFAKNPRFRYLKRNPSLPALDHFNTIIKEATAPYFMLFHDDDLLEREALSKLVAELNRNPNVVGVGSNAKVLLGRERTKYLFAPNQKANITISGSEELARHYLISALGHVPFPSYLYRRSAVFDLTMNFKQGQKHADVTFLLKAARRGPLRWISEPLLNYRRHPGNDSLSIDMRALLSLCRFLKTHTQVDDDLITEFKMKNFFSWYRQKNKGIAKSISPYRDLVFSKSSFWFLLKHPLVVMKAIKRKTIHRQEYSLKNPIFKK